MSKFTLSDLKPADRERVLREDSRRLGKGNGPTVSPTPPDVAAITERIYTRWWRTASKGISIVPVEVVKIGRAHLGEHWLDIVTSTGAIQRTRTDGADSYWPTREQAIQAVRARLEKAIVDANTERRKFLLREGLIA